MSSTTRLPPLFRKIQLPRELELLKLTSGRRQASYRLQESTDAG
jgi:hypothetical protein